MYYVFLRELILNLKSSTFFTCSIQDFTATQLLEMNFKSNSLTAFHIKFQTHHGNQTKSKCKVIWKTTLDLNLL